MSKTSEKLDAVAAALGAMSERLDAIEHRLDAQVVTVNMGTASGGMSGEDAVRIVAAVRRRPAQRAPAPGAVIDGPAADVVEALGMMQEGAVVRDIDDRDYTRTRTGWVWCGVRMATADIARHAPLVAMVGKGKQQDEPDAPRPVTVDEALAAAGITAGPPERGAVIRRNYDPALTSMGYGSAVADVYGCRRYRMAQGWCNAHGAVVRLEYPLTVVHTTAHWEDDE